MQYLMKSAAVVEGKIKITFPFNWQTVSEIKKNIEGRKFNSKGKYWTAPVSLANAMKLRDMGFNLDETLQSKLDKMQKSTLDKVEKQDLQIEMPKLNKTPYPYQKEGFSFVENRNGRALIGDEMGLGKTFQAIAYLALHPGKTPVIVLCPASLKYNWRKEINDTLPNPPEIEIVQGKSLYDISAPVIIINYDILPAWVDRLKELNPQVLIIDESHYIKNNKAQRTKATKKLAKNIPHIIGLSGTPITQRPIEFFNILKILDNDIVPNFWNYAQRYCGAKHNGFGWDFNGASNTQELHDRVNGRVMIRRKKKDVLKELPDKVYSHIPMPLTNEKEYELAEQDFVAYLKQELTKTITERLQESGIKDAERYINHEQVEKEAHKQGSKLNQLVELEKLKQVAVKGKMKAVIDWIKDFLSVDGKLVVFATHKFVINQLMKEFGDIAVKVDGSVSQEERHVNVTAFQENDKTRLFIGNIKAAGVGITLTAASNVAFIELPNTPGELDQAIDRVHRIGQEESVGVHYLLAMDTVEEKIAQIIDKKRKVVDSVLDGQETDSSLLIEEIVKAYTE